ASPASRLSARQECMSCMEASRPMLEACGLAKTFNPQSPNEVRALNGVDLPTYSRRVQRLRLSRDPPPGDRYTPRASGTDDPRVDDRYGSCDDPADAQVRRYRIRLSLPRALGPRISPS